MLPRLLGATNTELGTAVTWAGQTNTNIHMLGKQGGLSPAEGGQGHPKIPIPPGGGTHRAASAPAALKTNQTQIKQAKQNKQKTPNQQRKRKYLPLEKTQKCRNFQGKQRKSGREGERPGFG